MTIAQHAHPWIPRTLARARARHILDVRYRIIAEVTDRARRLAIDIELAFTFTNAVPPNGVLLDWRPQLDSRETRSALGTLSVNGDRPSGNLFRNGHIELPPCNLCRGANRVTMQYTAPIGNGDTAITRYLDRSDQTTYIYSLFVPADASTVFPCFDQPDLKARFTLTLIVPRHLRAVSCAPIVHDRRVGLRRHVRFAETAPISTYAFAFAAGPFVTTSAPKSLDKTRLWVRQSQSATARRQRDSVLALNQRAVDFFARYFAHDFPFAKYDLVLIPELPYRGMEHAGASFLNEACVLLPEACGDREQFERAQLIFHETAHQWMGDLVTMRGFDDLWIKEGFANFMAYKLAARIFPGQMSEVAFHVLKRLAYETDETRGTTPLHSPLNDLADAKAAYGNIVYAKAPAILREIEHALGASALRTRVRRFVRRHAYRVADWRDLHAALTEHDARCTDWLRDRILRPGIDVTHTDLSAYLADADRAYALIDFDRLSIDETIGRLPKLTAPLARMLIWSALWQAVRGAHLAPAQFVEVVRKHLSGDSDELTVTTVLGWVAVAMDRLLPGPDALAHARALEISLSQMSEQAATARLRSAWRQGFIAIATTAEACHQLERLQRTPWAVADASRTQHIAAMLIVRGACSLQTCVSRLPNGARTPNTRLILQACVPSEDVKRFVFDRLCRDMSVAEDTVFTALRYVNHPSHAALTEPLLASALSALPDLCLRRKIFFANRWVSSFVDGQVARGSRDVVRRFARERNLPRSLRRKLLEALDGIERTVRIRSRFH
jgi:hypothetical protein